MPTFTSLKVFLLVLALGAFTLSGCSIRKAPMNSAGNTRTPNPADSSPAAQNNRFGSPEKTLADFQPIAATQAELVTSKGSIVIQLFREQAPLTTLNFLSLAQSGFYDGIVFHRIVPDFVAQVGDPTTKDPNSTTPAGAGGPGYVIADEFAPELKHDKAGMVSMANAGPNTGGSQFFITFEATPWLDGKHAIFGQVISGMDVVQQLAVGDKIEKINLE